jgi:hypothetical protein
MTFRRWALADGADEVTVLALIRDAILPMYREWAQCTDLQLLRIDGARSYLATTRWQSREAFEEFRGPAGEDWRRRYQSVLERWDRLMTLEDAWEAEVILHAPTS